MKSQVIMKSQTIMMIVIQMTGDRLRPQHNTPTSWML